MENYNNIVEVEVISQAFIKSNNCYKRRNTLKTESLLDEARIFPENEEKHTIGHGCQTSTTKNNSATEPSTADAVTENTNISNNKDTESSHKLEKALHKYKVLLKYEEAPKHLQFNPFIRSGYRQHLPTKMCLKSIFWWTNETINIWSHLIGWFLFTGMTYSDIQIMTKYEDYADKIIIISLLFCFQMCMLLSSIYHIFSCRSEKDYDSFLTFDVFGIALSLLAIYISGIYYAFWCHENLRNYYSCSVIAIFITAIIMMIPSLNVPSSAKVVMFVAWAAFGLIPTTHWTIAMGGFQHPMVKLLVPRVIIMYFLVGIAFVFYISKIPERWFVGKVDYCGHSHNWWHIFVLIGLYYWHNTGLIYADFRMTHGCSGLPVTLE